MNTAMITVMMGLEVGRLLNMKGQTPAVTVLKKVDKAFILEIDLSNSCLRKPLAMINSLYLNMRIEIYVIYVCICYRIYIDIQ